MKKILLIIGAVVLVLILVAVFVLAYFGFVPGLSKLFVKQKNLGVTPSEEVALALYDEIGFDNTVVGSDDLVKSELKYSGKVDLKRDFTPEEVSSLLSSWGDNYFDTPFQNVQVKFNNDGSVEFSAVINVERAVSLARSLGYSDEQIDAAKKYAKFVSNEIPVYAKGIGGAVDNDVTVTATEMQAGNVQVPAEYVADISSAIEDAIEKRAAQITGLHADKLSFEDGKMTFDGTVPAKVEVE